MSATFPRVIWEGDAMDDDTGKYALRIVQTNRNTVAIEQRQTDDAMGRETWKCVSISKEIWGYAQNDTIKGALAEAMYAGFRALSDAADTREVPA